MSANASIILEKAEKVLAIKEALVQYDQETKEPYVEIEVGDQKSHLLTTPGQRTIYDRQNNKLTSVGFNQNLHYWNTRTLVFDKTPLKEVLRDMNLVYGVDFQIENQKIEKCSVTGEFKDQSLKDMIAVLEQILSINFESNQKYISVDGQGC